MNKEELLKVRYIVIADWPKNDGMPPGMIFTEEKESNMEYWDRFPHLFKKIGWWEYRNPLDMPKYVGRVRLDGEIEVLRVLDPKYNRREFGHEPNTIEHRFIFPNAYGYLPATEQEYFDYLTQQNKKA